MNDQINICIAGIKGYVGKALAKLVSKHPYLKLSGILVKKSETHCYSTLDLGYKKNIPTYTIDEIVESQTSIDALLLATPPDASIAIVKLLKECPIKIIDLSGAFRLPQNELFQWYGITHEIPELINGAPYGLSPWGFKNSPNQNVLANPGCYATCALLSLIPLLQKDIIENNNIIIDAKSGISGAGKKINADLMFCEMSENFFPYKVGKHQHIPEIKKALSEYANKTCNFTFITNMLPIKTGIAMSIYADAKNNFDSDEKITHAINKAYQSAYSHYPLIQFDVINKGDSKHDKFLLSLKSVVGTPNSHIGYFVDDGKIIIFSTIDNLFKGAASQAIENINALYHLPLETGLENLEIAI